MIRKKKSFVLSSRRTIRLTEIKLTSGRRRGGPRIGVSGVDLHQIENAAIHCDHGGQEGHDLKLIQDDGLEGVLGHGQDRENDQKHEDDQGLEKDTILDEEGLDQNQGYLSKHDYNLPIEESEGVASEKEA